MDADDAPQGVNFARRNTSKVAATLGDEFLVYLIDMAVLHVRTRAVHLEGNVEHRPPKASCARDAKSEYAHLR